MAGSVLHATLRRWAVIAAAGLLFGCAGQAVRPLPGKEGVATKVKPQPVAGVRMVEPGNVPVRKTPGASREPSAETPDPDTNAASDPSSTEISVPISPVFRYDYYPDREVYFDSDRHLYFYRTGGVWSMSVALPISFQEDLGASVQLTLESPRPYESHDQNRKAFPSGSGGRGF